MIGPVPNFELAGHDEKFLDAFSRRRREILAYLDKHALPHAREATQKATLHTRRRKVEAGPRPGPCPRRATAGRAAPRSFCGDGSTRPRAPAERIAEPEKGVLEGVERAVTHVEKRRIIIHTGKGEVSCICPVTQTQRPLAFQGFEKDRGTLKYRCPGGSTCEAARSARATPGAARRAMAGSPVYPWRPTAGSSRPRPTAVPPGNADTGTARPSERINSRLDRSSRLRGALHPQPRHDGSGPCRRRLTLDPPRRTSPQDRIPRENRVPDPGESRRIRLRGPDQARRGTDPASGPAPIRDRTRSRPPQASPEQGQRKSLTPRRR